MSTYDRTEHGFSAAFKAAKWMAEFHGRPYALFVSKMNPTKYSVSLPACVQKDYVEIGTIANLIGADGSMTPMFSD